MQITSIDLFPFSVPLKEPFIISLETITHAHNLLVRINTNEKEIIGWGESSPFRTINGETHDSQMALAPLLAREWIGKNPLEIENRMNELHRALYGNLSLKSAFDMALYDIASKYNEMPLYKFLGGTKNKKLITDQTVSIDSPENMVTQAKRFLAEGFNHIKVKLGKHALEDIKRIATLREELAANIPLRIDANQGWSVSDAILVLQSIEKYDVEHCEQPVHRKDYTGMKKVKENTSIHIMADESLCDSNDALLLIDQDCCKEFNIKLGKSGGILEATRIANVAKEVTINCQVGCFNESVLGITALAHFALSHDIIRYFDMDSPLMMAVNPIIGGVEYKTGGEVVLNDSIGIGCEVDSDFLKNLKGIRINH
jgi:L-Ala-D/L-Glu epimerase